MRSNSQVYRSPNTSPPGSLNRPLSAYPSNTNGAASPPQHPPAMTIRKKLVVVGDGGSGKSTLLKTFYTGKFPEGWLPILFDNIIKDISVDSRRLELALFNRGAWTSVLPDPKMCYDGADVILLCISVDAPWSLHMVEDRWKQERQKFHPKAPVLLVGLKKDVRVDEDKMDVMKKIHEKPTSFEEGVATARRLHAVAYLECSARTGEGVDELFQTAARVALSFRPSEGGGDNKDCVVM